MNNLTPKEGKILLNLARLSLENYFNGKKSFFDEKKLPPAFLEKTGVFVTLKNNGQLQGCIGLTESELPLYQAVMEMTLEAAFYDPRFLPLGEKDLPNTKIEISVLTKPRLTKNPSQIRLGVDGVIVKSGARSGLFLPQVATETGWNLAEFMDNLCAGKAGLAPDAWQQGNCEIYTFQVQKFEEK